MLNHSSLVLTYSVKSRQNKSLKLKYLPKYPSYQYLKYEHFSLSSLCNSHHCISLLARLILLFEVRDYIFNDTTKFKRYITVLS